MNEEQARKILLYIFILAVASLITWEMCGLIAHLSKVPWVYIAE